MIVMKKKSEVKEWHSDYSSIDQMNENCTNFLSYTWNKVKDTFKLKKRKMITCKTLLFKKECLSILARFWDPIGLVLPGYHRAAN